MACIPIPPTGIPVPGSPRSMSSAANLPAPALCIPGTETRPGLLADQRRYLLYYRELIRRLSGGETQLSEAAKSELSTALQAFLPDAPLTWMIELGADAVAAKLAAVRTATNRS